MGGFGSGSWYRWNKKECLDDHISVDIRRWKREGLLIPGNWFSWQWSVNGEVTASIHIQVEQNRVVLHYRQRVHGGDWQDVKEPINLTYTDCHYGSKRVWFSCPACGRRAAKLYSQVPYFVCRQCCDLPYQSQGETRADRILRKARKKRRKLDADMNLTMPVLDKPKGMHWKTFERLLEEAEQTNQVLNIEIIKRCGPLRDQFSNLLWLCT